VQKPHSAYRPSYRPAPAPYGSRAVRRY
jgi:hypothetical protein